MRLTRFWIIYSIPRLVLPVAEDLLHKAGYEEELKPCAPLPFPWCCVKSLSYISYLWRGTIVVSISSAPMAPSIYGDSSGFGNYLLRLNSGPITDTTLKSWILQSERTVKRHFLQCDCLRPFSWLEPRARCAWPHLEYVYIWSSKEYHELSFLQNYSLRFLIVVPWDIGACLLMSSQAYLLLSLRSVCTGIENIFHQFIHEKVTAEAG